MNRNLTSRWRRRAAAAGLMVAALFAMSGCEVSADFLFFGKSEQEQRYTMEIRIGDVTTEWEYQSQSPTEDDALATQPCLFGLMGEPAGFCQPEPLIFLKYDLGLGLDETRPANQVNEITVVGYYQERLSELPEVTELAVEVSFDAGSSWQEVPVEAVEANTFTAAIPPAGAAGDTVSLRVSAVDSHGNTVVQTMPDAYLLK